MSIWGNWCLFFFQVPQHSKPKYYSTGDNGFRMSVQRNIRRNTKQKHWPVGIQQVTPDWQHGRSRRESSGQLVKRIFTLLNTGLVYDTNHRLISLSLQVVTVSPCGGAQTGHCARVSSVKDLLSTSSPLTSWGLFTLWITLTLQCMNTHTHARRNGRAYKCSGLTAQVVATCCQLCFTGRCCIDTTAQQFILCFVGNTSLSLVNGDKQSYQKTLLTDANDINDSIWRCFVLVQCFHKDAVNTILTLASLSQRQLSPWMD